MRFDITNCIGVAALLSVTVMTFPALAQQATGSFQSSCRNVQNSGQTLTADCADRAGAYHSSSIAIGQCKGDIGNNNGVLNCNGATATINPQNANRNNGYNGSNGSNGNNGYNANNGYNGNRNDASGNGARGNNFPSGANGGFAPGAGRNNNGPDNRDSSGPRFGDQRQGGPRYNDQAQGPYDNGGRNAGPYPQFMPGPYPQFVSRERNIVQDIQTGQRYGRIGRRDANNLMDQLQVIQAREMRLYRVRGRNLRQVDSRSIARDLDLLSQSVRRLTRA